MGAYIYWASGPRILDAKIGRWDASYVRLRSRYVTTYGRSLTLIVWACPSDQADSFEKEVQRCMKGYHIELELYVKSLRSYAEFEFCIQRLTGQDAPTDPVTQDERNMLDFVDQVQEMTQSDSLDLAEWMINASREDQQRFVHVAFEQAYRKTRQLDLQPWRKFHAKLKVDAPAPSTVQSVINLCDALGLKSSVEGKHLITTSFLDQHYDSITVSVIIIK